MRYIVLVVFILCSCYNTVEIETISTLEAPYIELFIEPTADSINAKIVFNDLNRIKNIFIIDSGTNELISSLLKISQNDSLALYGNINSAVFELGHTYQLLINDINDNIILEGYTTIPVELGVIQDINLNNQLRVQWRSGMENLLFITYYHKEFGVRSSLIYPNDQNRITEDVKYYESLTSTGASSVFFDSITFTLITMDIAMSDFINIVSFYNNNQIVIDGSDPFGINSTIPISTSNIDGGFGIFGSYLVTDTTIVL